MYQGNFSPELERALDLPRNVLDAMIERKLRLEAAKRLGVSLRTLFYKMDRYGLE